LERTNWSPRQREKRTIKNLDIKPGIFFSNPFAAQLRDMCEKNEIIPE
jgi:hypothetical protein